MRYRVDALFETRVGGRLIRSSADRGHEDVYCEAPESAARRWLWRLTPAERAATVRLVVSAPGVSSYVPYPIYRGAEVVFVRAGGRLEEI